MADQTWPTVDEGTPWFSVSAHEQGKPGSATWQVQARSPMEAVQTVVRQYEGVSGDGPSERQRLMQLGQDLLEIIAVYMPDGYAFSDQRVRRAAEAMGMSVEQAVVWMQHL